MVIRLAMVYDIGHYGLSAIKELKLDVMLHSASHPLKAGYGKEDIPFIL